MHFPPERAHDIDFYPFYMKWPNCLVVDSSASRWWTYEGSKQVAYGCGSGESVSLRFPLFILRSRL
jgi:hypothetical protein